MVMMIMMMMIMTGDKDDRYVGSRDFCCDIGDGDNEDVENNDGNKYEGNDMKKTMIMVMINDDDD